MANAKPVRVMDPAQTQLTIVGCGGTGGFVVRDACRLLWGLKRARHAAHAEPGFAHPAFGGLPPEDVPEVLLCDQDVVERPNVVRQDFLPADVGRPKALVLAERMAGAYALPVCAYPRYVKDTTPLETLVPEGAVVVGCVDNAATRRVLHEKLSAYRDVVYIDAGNGAVRPAAVTGGGRPSRADLARERESGWSGQVVCGVRKGGETIIPFPADVMPDLIEGEGPEDLVPDEVPCNRVAVSHPQRFLTNRRAATVITEYLGPLLEDGHLLHARTFFDARRGYAKSYPAIDELDEVAA